MKREDCHRKMMTWLQRIQKEDIRDLEMFDYKEKETEMRLG